MITYLNFVTDFPEFADTTAYPQNRVERFIGKAAAQVDETLDLADEIIGNLAAHLLALSDMAGENSNAGGKQRVASLTVQGEYSVSYAPITQFGSGGATNSFDLTPYGMEFQRLLRLAGWGPQVV